MSSNRRVGTKRSHRALTATLAICGAMFASETRALAQCTNINAPETVSWANGLIVSALAQDSACRAGAPDRDTFATSTACNMFVGRVMARMYGLTTFVSQDHSFLKANDMAGLLPTWNDWIDLGTAGDQAVLSAASDEARLGYVVLAVWANPVRGKPGHVALVGPGPLTPSNSWGGLLTPVAASFTLDDVDKAFIGQPLACAFGGGKRSATHLWKYRKLASPR